MKPTFLQYRLFAISAVLLLPLIRANADEKSKAEPPKPAIELQKGLISEWKANGNALDSIGGNNGETHSGVSYSSVGEGQGFLFNGDDAGINIPDADNLKLTASLTISAWIDIYGYPAASKLWGQIVMRADDRSGLDPYFLAISPDKNLTFTVENSGSESDTVAYPVPMGQIFLATATLDDASGEMRLYANGTVIGERTAVVRPFKDLDPNSNPGIGIGDNQAFPKSIYHMGFNGIISDVRIYNRALTQDEVQALYSAGVPAPKAPVGVKASSK